MVVVGVFKIFMRRNNKGIVVVPILIIFLVIGVIGYFVYKSSVKQAKPSVIQNNNKSVTPSLTVSKGETIAPPAQINWQTFKDKQFGVSFDLPEGWNVVSAIGTNYVEYDLKNPEKDSLATLAVRKSSETPPDKAVEGRKKEMGSSEAIVLEDFQTSATNEGVSYLASGKKSYFNFKNDNAWEEGDFITYDFLEQGIFYTNGRSVFIHEMFLPSSQSKVLFDHVFSSFVFE